MTNSPTHVYYNVRIQNSSINGDDKVCSFRETRNLAIIDNPSKYYLSCVRFTVPTSTIPLLVVPVLDANTSKSIYAISLSFGDRISEKNILWYPNETVLENIRIRPISNNKASFNSRDPFYYLRSYNHFVNLLNETFIDCFDELKQFVDIDPSCTAPFVTYEPISKLFTLNAQEQFYDYTNETYIKVSFNNALFTLIGAFNTILKRNDNKSNDVQILIRNQLNNTFNGIINFVQEYPTISSWSGLKSIVITSGSLPILSEGIQNTNSYYSNDNSIESGTPSFLNIISDYDAMISINGRAEFVTNMQYNCNSEYRLIDMIGSNPLFTFDIMVYWADTMGILHELMVSPNESAQFKFLFRLRDFNK